MRHLDAACGDVDQETVMTAKGRLYKNFSFTLANNGNFCIICVWLNWYKCNILRIVDINNLI